MKSRSDGRVRPGPSHLGPAFTFKISVPLYLSLRIHLTVEVLYDGMGRKPPRGAAADADADGRHVLLELKRGFPDRYQVAGEQARQTLVDLATDTFLYGECLFNFLSFPTSSPDDSVFYGIRCMSYMMLISDCGSAAAVAHLGRERLAQRTVLPTAAATRIPAMTTYSVDVWCMSGTH